ncbi:unnamed protein product [Scytosiphon promiscuus]
MSFERQIIIVGHIAFWCIYVFSLVFFVLPTWEWTSESFKSHGQEISTASLASLLTPLWMLIVFGSGWIGSGHHLNSWAKNSHLPFLRRERAMSRFRRMRSLQKFVSIHSSVYNHFNHQKNIESRVRFKSLRDVALFEWRELIVA